SRHDLRLGHPSKNRREDRSALYGGALVEPAQDRNPAVDVSGVRLQATDQVVPAGCGAHRWKPPPASRVQPVKTFEMDSQTRIELGLYECGANVERHIGIGERDAPDRLEPFASRVELARDVVVREAG